MPTVQVTGYLTVEDLLGLVARLPPPELAQFGRGWEQLRQRPRSLREEVAQRAEAYHFDPRQQARLSELLDRNKEGSITPGEEEEMEGLLAELDQRNLQLADDLLQLAREQRCPRNMTNATRGIVGNGDAEATDRLIEAIESGEV
jgi:hypothetical protein